VPGKDSPFGRLIAAQSAGDAAVLADHGRPVLRLHLTDQDAGLAALRAALS
jgi:antitoxin (DNA-binding transcriptional repressor) of toxin-antitoxin stability system